MGGNRIIRRSDLHREKRIMYRLNRIGIIGIVLFVGLAELVAAAPTVERVTVASEVLGEDRPLNIALPNNYSPDKAYPVVYALDGGARYVPVLAERMHEKHPGLIIVGIENIDRTRDMFPESMPEKQGRGGGGELFLEFITSELIPFVEDRYGVSDYRVISGQSNSGFFVLYAMLHSPDAFDAYLASSPMIGWDWEMIRDDSIALFESRESYPKALYMNQGESDYDQTTEFLPKYVDLLEKIVPGDFRMRSEVVKGSGHVPDSSYGSGIAFIFESRK